MKTDIISNIALQLMLTFQRISPQDLHVLQRSKGTIHQLVITVIILAVTHLRDRCNIFQPVLLLMVTSLLLITPFGTDDDAGERKGVNAVKGNYCGKEGSGEKENREG